MGLMHERPEAGPYERGDPSGRHKACLIEGCVWKRLAKLENEPEGFTPIGKLLHAYYLDLAEVCVCPNAHGRAT